MPRWLRFLSPILIIDGTQIFEVHYGTLISPSPGNGCFRNDDSEKGRKKDGFKGRKKGLFGLLKGWTIDSQAISDELKE